MMYNSARRLFKALERMITLRVAKAKDISEKMEGTANKILYLL